MHQAWQVIHSSLACLIAQKLPVTQQEDGSLSYQELTSRHKTAVLFFLLTYYKLCTSTENRLVPLQMGGLNHLKFCVVLNSNY